MTNQTFLDYAGGDTSADLIARIVTDDLVNELKAIFRVILTGVGRQGTESHTTIESVELLVPPSGYLIDFAIHDFTWMQMALHHRRRYFERYNPCDKHPIGSSLYLDAVLVKGENLEVKETVKIRLDLTSEQTNTFAREFDCFYWPAMAKRKSVMILSEAEINRARDVGMVVTVLHPVIVEGLAFLCEFNGMLG